MAHTFIHPPTPDSKKLLKAAFKNVRRVHPVRMASRQRLVESYSKQIKSLVLDPLFDLQKELLIAELRSLVIQSKAGLDTAYFAQDALSDALASIFARIKKGLSERITERQLTDLASKQFNAVDVFNATQVQRQIKSVTAVDVFFGSKAAVQQGRLFVQDNLSLIKGLADTHTTKVERAVFNNFRSGARAGAMVEEIREITGRTKRSAELIARDQTNKLNGALTKARNQELGIEKFEWQTAGDDRVRPEHEDLDGRVFTWASGAGPDGIYPGEEINCRCTSIPVIDETAQSEE